MSMCGDLFINTSNTKLHLVFYKYALVKYVGVIKKGQVLITLHQHQRSRGTAEGCGCVTQNADLRVYEPEMFEKDKSCLSRKKKKRKKS